MEAALLVLPQKPPVLITAPLEPCASTQVSTEVPEGPEPSLTQNIMGQLPDHGPEQCVPQFLHLPRLHETQGSVLSTHYIEQGIAV